MKSLELTTPRFEKRVFYCLITIIVATGSFLILGNLGAADFDADEYNAMKLVDKDFTYYVNTFHFSKVISAQFWICDRLFDGALIGYRLPGALFGTANLVLVAFLALRIWPKHRSAVVCAVFLLAFNKEAIWFSRWGMATYAQYLFLGSCLYFFLISRIQNPRSTGLLGATMAIAIPWIHFGLLIPFTFGVALLAAFELFSEGRPRPITFLRSVWRYKLLGLSIPSFVIAYRVLEPKNWYSALPYLIPYDFPKTSYSKDISGALEFGINNGIELLRGLVLTDNLDIGTIDFDNTLWKIAFGLSAIAAIRSITSFRQRTRLFTILYITGTAFLIYLLCLKGLYRYGTPRYALFLITPVAVLAGVGLSDILHFSKRITESNSPTPKKMIARVPQTLLATTGLFVVGAILGWRTLTIHDERVQQRKTNDKAINYVNDQILNDPKAFLLVDGQSIYWFRIKWPDWEDRGEWMGYQNENYPDHLRRTPSAFLRAATTDKFNPITKVVTVTSRDFTVENYPEYAQLLNNSGYFKTTEATVERKVFVNSLRQVAGISQTLPHKMGISECSIDEQGIIKVRGWALSQLPIQDISIRVNGKLIGQAQRSMPRPDIYKAHPEYHDRSPGFMFVSASPISDRGKLDVRIECTSKINNEFIVVSDAKRVLSR